MPSAAEQWAEERWPESADRPATFAIRAMQRAAAIEAFNAGLERAATIADKHAEGNDPGVEFDRGWYRASMLIAAAIRKERSDAK